MTASKPYRTRNANCLNNIDSSIDFANEKANDERGSMT